MTPTEIETLARQRYNAVGDTFFPQDMLLNHIYNASMILAQKARVIKTIETTSSVVGQRAYAFPARVISIKRVEYDSRRVDPIDLIDDDTVTLLNSADLSQGSPRFYTQWADEIYFRPIPDSIKTINIWVYKEPAAITASSTMEIPTRYHLNIVDYLLFCMFGQDKDRLMADFHYQIWTKHVEDAIKWERKREVGDQYKTVKDTDYIPTNFVRII